MRSSFNLFSLFINGGSALNVRAGRAQSSFAKRFTFQPHQSPQLGAEHGVLLDDAIQAATWRS